MTSTPIDLAVIFRPGLMSHPDHELSPTEHQLSQDVLEFLIAHQDWFMLDTPLPPAFPPASSRSRTPPTSRYDASARTSVSDGEGPDGWRIIQRHQRSADDRGRHAATMTAAGRGEQPPSGSAAAPPGIVRSRTLPTSRKGRSGGGAAADGTSAPVAKQGAGGVGPGVLRKTRRASVQPG